MWRMEGEFKDGYLHGIGSITFKNGDSYNGYFYAG